MHRCTSGIPSPALNQVHRYQFPFPFLLACRSRWRQVHSTQTKSQNPHVNRREIGHCSKEGQRDVDESRVKLHRHTITIVDRPGQKNERKTRHVTHAEITTHAALTDAQQVNLRRYPGRSRLTPTRAQIPFVALCCSTNNRTHKEHQAIGT